MNEWSPCGLYIAENIKTYQCHVIKRWWRYYPQWRSALWTSMKELLLLLKFDNSSPSHAYELMTHYHLRRSTQWNHLNEVYLQSKFAVDWRYSDFQTGHFAEFKQFKVDIHFADIGQVTIDPTHSLFLTLDRSQLFYWVWAKQAAKNNPNRHCLIKNSRTTHRIWYKSFSMIQSAGIKNWGPQSIKRLQSFSLLFLFVTRFSDFCDKIKYAC